MTKIQTTKNARKSIKSTFLAPCPPYPISPLSHHRPTPTVVSGRTIIEQGWQPLLDLLRQMPCHEDFEEWNTRVRIDFLRKWYHTRARNVRTFSLEAALEEGEGRLYYIPDTTQNVEEAVIAQDYSERFFARLSKRDQAILQLRLDGFTHVQIAERLGYANHSGVFKRMQAIRTAFEQYQNK